MEEKQQEKYEPVKEGNWHDRNYKKLLLLPLILVILSFAYIGYFYSVNGDFMHKDISLTGGTSVTITTDLDAAQLELDLATQLVDLNIREIYDIITREQKAIIIETTNDGDITKQVLEDYLGYELTEENSSFEFTGSALSESFFQQLLIAILVAFVFMAIVVFIIFRTLIPSSAVIISAFADILMTLALVDVLGLKMSSAGIVAFLMLIGYSVDTDIMLTTRILKRHEGTINTRLRGALSTGLTMTLTSLLAVVIALLIVKSFSIVLTQIFTILAIGLAFDIFNTWITNASIIKWYALKKQ